MITLKTKKNWQQRIEFFEHQAFLKPLYSQKQLKLKFQRDDCGLQLQNLEQWDGFFILSAMWLP